jgi:hypothetical protein
MKKYNILNFEKSSHEFTIDNIHTIEHQIKQGNSYYSKN